MKEDIPVQPTEGPLPSDSNKVLVSISEDADGEGREDVGLPNDSAAPSLGAGAKLAGILRREGRDSKEGRESGRFGSKDKESSKFTPTKFSSGNIAIPGLKRKDKDKTRNGEKKEKESANISDEGRKGDKRDRMKERSNGFANGSSNRNSGVYSSSEGGGDVTDYYSGSEDVSPTKGTGKSGKYHKEQEQIQQLLEMKNMTRPSSSSASSSLHDPQQGSPQVLHSSVMSAAVQQLKHQDSTSLSDSISSSSLMLDFRKGSSDGQPEYRNMDSIESTDI
ncbi:hypothetical protein FHG87_009333 [Trinorchestia longiramus]|nr:hypothetical protein FHG87_009333 [Trinorchestia longiramus]